MTLTQQIRAQMALLPPTDLAIEVRDLTFDFNGAHKALDGVNLDLARGSRTLLVGANGAGKSTLLRLLAGKTMVKGGVRVLGKNPFFESNLGVTYLGTEWAMNPVVRRDIPVARLLKSLGAQEHPERCSQLLDIMDIDPDWHMHEVSDGQRRRVQIVLGLMKPWDVLLLDEVTVDLDVLVRRDLLDFLVSETQTRPCTIVYATHIFDGLGGWPTHVAHIADGVMLKVRDVMGQGGFPELEEERALSRAGREGAGGMLIEVDNSPLLRVVEKWLREDYKTRKEKIARGLVEANAQPRTKWEDLNDKMKEDLVASSPRYPPAASRLNRRSRYALEENTAGASGCIATAILIPAAPASASVAPFAAGRFLNRRDRGTHLNLFKAAAKDAAYSPPPSSTPSYSEPSECLPIDATHACAPWTSGFFINATAITLNYGLDSHIGNADEWNDIVVNLAYGGELLGESLGNYTGCGDYGGEPIQFLRTYLCLFDIFDASAGCNEDALLKLSSKAGDYQPVCSETCDDYGAAVESLFVDYGACPETEEDKLIRHRSEVAGGQDVCKKIVSEFEGSTYGHDDCTVGVDADLYTCGFGGNLDAAAAFCEEVSDHPCCEAFAAAVAQGYEGSSSELSASVYAGSSKAALNVAQKDTVTDLKNEGQNVWNNNKAIVIVVAVVIVLLIVACCACCFCRGSRSRAARRNNRVAGLAPIGAAGGGMRGNEKAPLKGAYPTPYGAGQGAIVAGTGAAPSSAYRVKHAYNPQLSDEVELRPGDVIELTAQYDDGWGKGENMRTHLVGTFPMACVVAMN
ncbi:CCR4-NOT regulatory complex component [Irineochytrium annulatum]|nr:CCR4-NOT regulatory complex component [Irineochytrium annulatum]